MHAAEIVTVSEDCVLNLESTQMEHVHVTSCKEIKKSQIAEVNNIEIQNNSTVVGQKITQDRRSKGKNLNDISDEENDVIYNINGEDYKKFCLAKLCDKELKTKLVEVLHDSSTLEDFVKPITQLSEGTLDAMNMSFLLCLEVAKLKFLKSTTAMRFRREMKQFWEVVYRICHGKGLGLFSGLKNQDCLQSGGERGSYNPEKSNHNFTVPDEKSLRKSTDDLPSVIPCGIIEESFKLLDKNKQYVISIDGKKIATGLLKDDIGDINLWGFEEPTIESCKERKELNMAILEDFEDMIDNGTPEEKMVKLPEIPSMMTGYLADIHQTELGHKRLLMRLFKLSLNNPDNKKNYTFGMNVVKAYVYTTSEWTERALQNNKDICCTMADIRHLQMI